MLEILIGVYGLAVWLVMFKFKWITPTSMSIAWSCIIGAFLIGGLLYLMWLFAPGSSGAMIVSPSTPIVPRVEGYVTEVTAEPNKLVEAGEPLLVIDPLPYEETLAELQEQRELLVTRRKRLEKLTVQDFASKRQLEEIIIEIDAIDSRIRNATYDLESTVVRAPAAGFATFVSVRPGHYTKALPLSPIMVFVQNERVLMGAFRQVLHDYIEPGAEAEVIFDALPGYVFSARVDGVIPINAAGQFVASGRMVAAQHFAQGQPFLVRFTTDFDLRELNLPAGAQAHIAVYSDTFTGIEVMRRMLIRIMSWKNYLPIKTY